MSAATATAEKIVRALIFDVVVTLTATTLEVEAPWLKLPVVNQVFRFCLNRLADRIYVQLDRTVVFAVIDIETNAQKTAYEKAAAALKAEIAKQEKDDAAIEAAKKEFKDRLARLIHLNP